MKNRTLNYDLTKTNMVASIVLTRLHFDFVVLLSLAPGLGPRILSLVAVKSAPGSELEIVEGKDKSNIVPLYYTLKSL